MARHTSRLLDVAETAVRNADYVKSQLKSQNDALIGLIKDMTSTSDQIEAIMSTATSNLFGATDEAVVKAEKAGLASRHSCRKPDRGHPTGRKPVERHRGHRSRTRSERIRGASLEVDRCLRPLDVKMRDATKQANDEAENHRQDAGRTFPQPDGRGRPRGRPRRLHRPPAPQGGRGTRPDRRSGQHANRPDQRILRQSRQGHHRRRRRFRTSRGTDQRHRRRSAPASRG